MTKEKSMEPLDQLREWGYRVDVAQQHEGFDVYFVEGFGLASYVRGDDLEALAALVDPAAHAERVTQQGETHDETTLRWHDDPDNEFALPEEAVAETRDRVQVARELREQQQAAEDAAAEEDDDG